MYDCFGLVLMVTHACNLRCRYCYVGAKSPQPMARRTAGASIDRAVASIAPGGTLELGFFGGEPLLEAEIVAEAILYAERCCADSGLDVRLSITTNGTIVTDDAWWVMSLPEMQTSISHDGLPEVHDRHRLTSDGRNTSQRVLRTIRRLLDAGRDPHVVMVVRPDSAASLPEGVLFLREQGVRHIDPTLDLWTQWSRQEAESLRESLARCADIWQAGLPHHSISWFDEKAAHLAGVPVAPTARCGFGDGEIAVAVSGNLYPCERLIGEDNAKNPMRMAGHAVEGEDFCFPPALASVAEGCSACAIAGGCNTTCRCSNYIRTGDVRSPDGLLCMLDQVCYHETARILRKLPAVCASSLTHQGVV